MMRRPDDGITVEQDGRVVVVRRRWRSGRRLAVAAAAVVLSFVTVVFAVPWLTDDRVEDEMRAELFIGLIVTVVVDYVALAGVVNTTTIRVAPGRVDVRQGPVPWPGRRSRRTEDLARLEVRLREVGNRTPGVFALLHRDPEFRHDIVAVPAEGSGGTALGLVRLDDQREAVRLARVLGAAMGLPRETSDDV